MCYNISLIFTVPYFFKAAFMPFLVCFISYAFIVRKRAAWIFFKCSLCVERRQRWANDDNVCFCLNYSLVPLQQLFFWDRRQPYFVLYWFIAHFGHVLKWKRIIHLTTSKHNSSQIWYHSYTSALGSKPSAQWWWWWWWVKLTGRTQRMLTE